jgi:hypothetical protein
MKTKTLNEQATIREAMTLLLTHLGPAKVAQFLAAQSTAGGDYLRDEGDPQMAQMNTDSEPGSP